MRFSYPFTCPKIDANINDFKSNLECFIHDLILKLSPRYLETSDAKLFIQEKQLVFYAENESIFENVRQSNEDIRKSAESQIDDIQIELNSYKNSCTCEN